MSINKYFNYFIYLSVNYFYAFTISIQTFELNLLKYKYNFDSYIRITSNVW